MLYAPLNIGPAARETGQYIARAGMQTDPAERNMDILRATSTGAESFSNVGAWLVGPRPQANVQSPSQLAAARATYVAEAEVNQAFKLPPAPGMEYPPVTIVDVNGVTRTVSPTSNMGGIHGMGVSMEQDITEAGLKIWNEGLPMKGSNFNIERHVYAKEGSVEALESGFRGTSQLPGLSAKFALRNSEQGLLIEVRRVPSFDTQMVLENAGKPQFLFANEVENSIHALQKNIDNIMSIRTVFGTPDKPIYGPYIPKPTIKE